VFLLLWEIVRFLLELYGKRREEKLVEKLNEKNTQKPEGAGGVLSRMRQKMYSKKGREYSLIATRFFAYL